MKTASQLKYANSDVEVLCHVFPNNDAEVKYSEETGFFIETFIYQKRVGRAWESMDDNDCSIPGIILGEEIPELPFATRRLVTYRPITRDQAMRILLDGLPDLGGIISTINDALDSYGVESLQG